MGEINRGIGNTTKVFGSVMVLALFGLVALIIFGNLSGNLGFQSESVTYINESITDLNETAYVLTGFTQEGYESLSVTSVWNATLPGTFLIASGNYTVNSALGTINGTNASAAPGWRYSNVTVSYVVTHKGSTEVDTEEVIGNITSGTTGFFSFAPIWFTLLAVALLVIIAFSLVKVVQNQGGSGNKNNSMGSRFAS